jgi:hypothetical protein
MLQLLRVYGNREIVDIKGCPQGSTPANCPKTGHEQIWFVTQHDPVWIYVTTPADKYDWEMAQVSKEVADSTQFAAELFPLLIKLGGFTMGLSSRLAAVLISSVLDALGEQGMRSAKGEEMQSAIDIIKGIGLDVFVAKFTDGLFGKGRDVKLPKELETGVERSMPRARAVVAETDAALVEGELKANKARLVQDDELAAKGYHTEVDVVSEGQQHTWRQKTDGNWCRFSDDPLCVGQINSAVDAAAHEHPPNFTRDLAAAGVTKRARNKLGKETLSVNDLVVLHGPASPVSTDWMRVRSAVDRGGYELRITPASEYGLDGYIRYHIRAPGLGKEGYPIPLAPEWMNHGANDIEGFMRARLKQGYTVRFQVARNTFGGAELRPWFEQLLQHGDSATLGRVALDQGNVERFLKDITYKVETYRYVGGRTQHEIWQATMQTGLPPAGGIVNRGLPLIKIKG